MKKFKLVTLLGIRPDIIRMYKLLQLLDKGQRTGEYEHVYAHTGQHFDYQLDGVFYKQLGVKKPEVNFAIGKILQKAGAKTSYEFQMALLFEKLELFIKKYQPDAILYLGDTNSVLSSIIAARNSIPVIHIEGGGRSYDWRMPEEKNRIIIDHLSDMIYCYLPRYQDILLSEGVMKKRIKVVGNLIDDAIKEFLPLAKKSTVLRKLKQEARSYALVTIHREENTTDKKTLATKLDAIIRLSEEMPVVFPVMPRVKRLLKDFKLNSKLDLSNVIQVAPLGFLDFLNLEMCARVIITDSGTVQEEALILGVPCLVTRLSTERPETITAGATILANDNLLHNAHKALTLKRTWDRTILNPYPTSPSDVIFEDLQKKIKSGFFKSSRSYPAIKQNPFVREAYGKS